MLRKLYYILSPSMRLFIRRFVFFPVDLFEKVTGRRQEMVPPRGLIFTGSGNFVKAGDSFLKLFIEQGGLKPKHRVLDIGSGIGRMARPLTGYLSQEGSYEGFDLVERGVKWCNENITKKYPHFKFQKFDLLNDLYTSKGDSANKFVFPYKDSEFDFVFLISVFTHMTPEEVENYMKQIHRVMKSGGVCFATFFILNDDSIDKMKSGNFCFKKDFGHYSLMDEKVKAANVAYKEDYLLEELLHGNDFKVRKILYGHWSDKDADNKCDFQDIVIFEKK